MNARFKIDGIAKNMENHYRILKARYIEIKKVKELSGVGWDDDTLDPIVAFTYAEAWCYKFFK